MEKEMRLAVLIDAENISSKYVDVILREANNLGNVIYRRIYGNWTSSNMSSWKKVILDNALQPIQQYSFTMGKNSTDSALIIDAMDLLYQNRLDGFCLVSSDSDFTRLAARLRESEMFVLGMGEKKTPRSFISACNKFAYIDLLHKASMQECGEVNPLAVQESADQQAKTEHKNMSEQVKSATQIDAEQKLKDTSSLDHAFPQPEPMDVLDECCTTDDCKAYCKGTGSDLDAVRTILVELVDERSGDDGWIFLGSIGNLLAKRMPDFDVRNFGYKKLTHFMESLEMFETKEIPSKDDPCVKAVYFRLKN